MAHLAILQTSAIPDGHRTRLYSRLYWGMSRMSAVFVVGCAAFFLCAGLVRACAIGTGEAFADAVLPALLLPALALITLWPHKRISATDAGLEIGGGKRRKLIPWADVSEVREERWHALRTLGMKMWRVELQGGKPFLFCGLPDARDTVIEYLKRDER